MVAPHLQVASQVATTLYARQGAGLTAIQKAYDSFRGAVESSFCGADHVGCCTHDTP